MTGNTPSPTPFSSSLSFTSTHAYKPHIRSDEEPSGRRRGCGNNILPERTDFALPSIRQLSAAVLQQQQQQQIHHAALYTFTQTFPLPPKKAHVAPCAQTRLVAAVVVLLVLSKTCIMQIGKRIYTLLLRQCSQAGPANQQGMFSYILEIAHHCHRHRKQVCSPFRCRIAAAVVALGLGMLSRGGEGGVKSSFHVPRPVAWTINMPRLSPSDIFNFQTYIHSSTTDTTMQYVLR